MLTPYSPKTGLYWPPVVARVGRRPWRCRCGLPYWWPPVLADAVAVRRGGGRPCGWLVCWLAVLSAVRRGGGRSVAGVRPWPWWPFSWPVAAFWPSAGPLVRRGPFVARGGPFGPCVLAFQLVVFRRRLWPVAAGVRCWSLRALCAPSAVAVAVSLAVLAGVAGVGVIAPCRGPWPVSLAASMGRRVVVCWWCHCAVPCWVVCRVRPSVLVSAVAVAGRPSVLAGVLVCGRWLAVVSCRIPWPWRPVWAVGGVGVRRWSLRPVWALFWALLAGWPCGPCQWLAAVAGGACACGGACLVNERRPVLAGGGPCAVLSWCGVRLPCLWWSLLVSHQRRPWPSV